MKIRTDYVTNSSSSSFILGFKNTEDISEIIKNELPSYWSEATIQGVISDIENGITSHEEAIELYKSHIYHWDWRFNGKSYWDMTREERLSQEWLDFKEAKKNELSRSLANELAQYDIISIVEYEDHTALGNELEQHIMPYLNNTIQRISHH